MGSQATELLATDGGFDGRSGMYGRRAATIDRLFNEAAIKDDRTHTNLQNLQARTLNLARFMRQ